MLNDMFPKVLPIHLSFSLQNRNFLNLIFIIFGFSFSFLSLIHNIYFGQTFHLFTISKAHFLFSDFYTNLDVENLGSNKLILQIMKWNHQ